jgi:hypothetical protein
MLKQIATFLMTLVVLVGVFLVVERTSSPSFQKCVGEESAYEGKQASDKGNSRISPIISTYVRCSGRFMDGHGVGLTAIATFIIAAFTATLWIATKQQGLLTFEALKLARQEFLSTHRPKIILREAYTLDLIEGEEVRIFLHLANIGESKGTIISSQASPQTISSNRVMIAAPLDEKFDKIFGLIVLEPGEAQIVELPYGAPIWRDDMYRQKSNLTTPPTYRFDYCLHLVGQFMYLDELGVRRRTAFRRELNPERRRFYMMKEEPDMDYAD